MKKPIIATLILLSTQCSLAYAQNDIAADMMKQSMISDMQAGCEDKQFLQCTGMDYKKCLSVAVKTISDCEHLIPEDSVIMSDETALDAFSVCTRNKSLKNIGISAEKLEACDTNISGDDLSMNNDDMNMEEMNSEMEKGMSMLNQALGQQTSITNINTDGVTLPVYKNATVMSMTTEVITEGFLPALMLASPDSLEQIASFYRRNLNGFTESDFYGDILFMKGSVGFQSITNLEQLTSTPHVIISQQVSGGPPGTKSSIEISYEK